MPVSSRGRERGMGQVKPEKTVEKGKKQEKLLKP